MTTRPVPLVTQLENRSSSLSKDAKMVNCYAEIAQDKKAYAIKRFGYDAGTLYEVGTAQGLVTYLGVTRVIINNKFFKSPGNAVAIAAGGLLVDFA